MTCRGGLSAAAAGGRRKRRTVSAAVEKSEVMRKPERFFGHRKVEGRAATWPARRRANPRWGNLQILAAVPNKQIDLPSEKNQSFRIGLQTNERFPDL